jgi:hypothetical protein
VKCRLFVLNCCTAVFLMTLAALALTPALTGPRWDGQVNDVEAQRNERSTPRSFILPATPAVAEEQEQQAREVKEGVNVFRCLGRLRVLGYGADDTPPAFRARNLDAVFRFQKDHGLTLTARLDRETVRMLQCQD